MLEARAQPIATALLVAMLVAAATVASVFEAPERALLGVCLHLRGRLSTPPEIQVVTIDEKALARFGQMPWDRRIFARLLDRLAADGVKAVGLDIAFHEPARGPAEDQGLAAALIRQGRTVLPAYRAYARGGRTALFKPLPAFQHAAVALGLAQFSTVPEEMPLSFEPLQQEGDTRLPTFALAVARAAGMRVATEPGYLNSLGPAHHFPEFSFGDALDAPAGTFRDHLVLVGSTARGLPDTNFTSPFMEAGPVSGVELHATALANLLTDSVLHRPAPLWVVLGCLLLGVFPGAWLASPQPELLKRRLGLYAIALLALVGLTQVAIARHWWVEVVPGVLVLTLCLVAGFAAQQARLLQDRNRLLEWYAADVARESARERARIDGELHDEAQQLLIALIRDLRRVRKLFERDPQEALDRVEASEGLGRRILDEIMRVRKDMVPHTLERSGLVAAIEEMASDYQRRSEDLAVAVELRSWENRLDPLFEAELYWLIKEALNNALKHAQAHHVRIGLERGARWVVVSLEDDGRGFVVPDLDRAPAGPEHSGLRRMALRVRALKGILSLRSAPGAGTRLEIRVPVEGGSR